jgi:hypothetical protein
VPVVTRQGSEFTHRADRGADALSDGLTGRAQWPPRHAPAFVKSAAIHHMKSILDNQD